MTPVRLDITGGTAVLTLARPEQGNRLDREMMEALCDAVDRIGAVEGLRAVLLRAEGENFCVGGALDEFGVDEPLATRIRRDLGPAHAMIARLAALPVPVVAQLRGAVAGGGIGLGLAADIVLASDTAFFRAGYPGIGLSPDLGTSWQLARRAGHAVAMEFLISNRRMAADEALAHGLVNAVHPDAALSAATDALMESLASGPTLSHAAVKRLLNHGGGDLAEHLAKEAEAMAVCAQSADSIAAIEDFRAKRPARFTGR